MQEAILLFQFTSDRAAAIRGALSPEARADAPDVPKARADISTVEGGLTVRIRADDLSALRAAVNSYIRWIDAAERAARVAEG